jgi:hypothetical protein
MTTVPGAETTRRASWLRVTGIAALALVSAAVIVHHVSLSALSRQLDAADPTAQLDYLDARVAIVTQQVDRQQQQPATLLQSRYETDQKALVDRLSAFEQALDEQRRNQREYAQDVERRMTQLGSRMANTATGSRSRRAASADTAASPPRPPFRVIGVEQRADERFVVILPDGAATVSQLQLLRAGDTHAGWQLDTIAADHVVLRHGDAGTSVPIRARVGDTR